MRRVIVCQVMGAALLCAASGVAWAQGAALSGEAPVVKVGDSWRLVRATVAPAKRSGNPCEPLPRLQPIAWKPSTVMAPW